MGLNEAQYLRAPFKSFPGPLYFLDIEQHMAATLLTQELLMYHCGDALTEKTPLEKYKRGLCHKKVKIQDDN